MLVLYLNTYLYWARVSLSHRLQIWGVPQASRTDVEKLARVCCEIRLIPRKIRNTASKSRGKDSRSFTYWHITKADTAQPMVYSVQTITDCQYSCRLSRQFQTVKKVADCHDSCILSWQFQTIRTTADISRPLQTCLFLSLQCNGDSPKWMAPWLWLVFHTIAMVKISLSLLQD